MACPGSPALHSPASQGCPQMYRSLHVCSLHLHHRLLGAEAMVVEGRSTGWVSIASGGSRGGTAEGGFLPPALWGTLSLSVSREALQL